MPNPPYSGCVIILRENQDGIGARVFHWAEIPQGLPIPPSPAGLEHSMYASNPAPSPTIDRMSSTRTALKAAFAQFIDNNFPDTAP